MFTFLFVFGLIVFALSLIVAVVMVRAAKWLGEKADKNKKW